MTEHLQKQAATTLCPLATNVQHTTETRDILLPFNRHSLTPWRRTRQAMQISSAPSTTYIRLRQHKRSETHASTSHITFWTQNRRYHCPSTTITAPLGTPSHKDVVPTACGRVALDFAAATTIPCSVKPNAERPLARQLRPSSLHRKRQPRHCSQHLEASEVPPVQTQGELQASHQPANSRARPRMALRRRGSSWGRCL